MVDESNSTQRALDALMAEMETNNTTVSLSLVQGIYSIEEQVQFLDDRGSISERIAKLVRTELDKNEVG